MSEVQKEHSIQIPIGNYLGRRVSVIISEEFKDKHYALDGALVLVFVSNLSSCELKPVYSRILEKGALGISVSGKNVDLQFEDLIQLTSLYKTAHHVNTGKFGYTNFSQVAEYFLISSLPSPELFDEWVEYVLIYLIDPLHLNSRVNFEVESVASWLVS